MLDKTWIPALEQGLPFWDKLTQEEKKEIQSTGEVLEFEREGRYTAAMRSVWE